PKSPTGFKMPAKLNSHWLSLSMFGCHRRRNSPPPVASLRRLAIIDDHMKGKHMPASETKTIEQVVCPNQSCKYSWWPRVTNPRQCPKCHVFVDGPRREARGKKK